LNIVLNDEVSDTYQPVGRQQAIRLRTNACDIKNNFLTIAII